MKEEQFRPMSIVDLLLIDHSYLKKCIKVLTAEDESKSKKKTVAKSFLDTLKKHSEGEKKALYPNLNTKAHFHLMILEGEIEHGIVDQKVKMLIPKIARSTYLSDELESEMKVVAELVHHHVKEEENDLFPQIRREIEEKKLLQWGNSFLKVRKFSQKDFDSLPLFQRISHQVGKKVGEYFGEANI